MKSLPALALLLALTATACSDPNGDSAASMDRGADARAERLGPPNRATLIREQHLPNIELVTHEGRPVRFYDDLVKGKVVAINFMFTTCLDKCPVATENLIAVRNALGERMDRDVTLLSISLDAEHDTPDVLREYAQAHGAGGPGWYFLTGRPADIDGLRRKLGAYELDPVLDADRAQHAGIVILGNEPQGRWRAISALSQPVRIRQAIERTLLPPDRWQTGDAAVREVPYEVREAVEAPDLSDVRVIR